MVTNRSDVGFSSSFNHANLCYNILCWLLNIYVGYLSITAGAHDQCAWQGFDLSSLYCSTTYQTLSLRSIQTLYDKKILLYCMYVVQFLVEEIFGKFLIGNFWQVKLCLFVCFIYVMRHS